MKVLLINGSPHPQGCTYTALREVADALEHEGVETKFLHVSPHTVGCSACGQCARTGKCIVDDQVNDVLARLEEWDGLVVGSPVYYAGPAGQLTAFLDRLFYASGGRLAGKPAAAVVSCRRGGAATAFDQLNKYFSISNMPIATSQYWNQVHGNTAEEVVQDLEGMQTMRTLGKNIAWMLKCRQAAQRAGVQAPEYEPQIITNFIR